MGWQRRNFPVGRAQSQFKSLLKEKRHDKFAGK
jgi:hypothetical protein